MSVMVEKVAKALEPGNACIHGFPCEFCDDAPTENKRDGAGCRWLARAAIQAMRDPTDTMIMAADGEYRDDDRKALLGEWQTMIDAALAPAVME